MPNTILSVKKSLVLHNLHQSNAKLSSQSLVKLMLGCRAVVFREGLLSDLQFIA